VGFAGPALGESNWRRPLGQFIAAEPGLEVVTLHAYPLQLCFISRSSPRYPTIAHLLAPAASTGFANRLASYLAIAHAHRLPLRIDELNSVTCGGDAAVSNTFAAALWAVDVLFELTRVGVDGVNVHTFPGAGYELFRISHANGRWRAVVSPEYYGLLMFAQAAPPGARLLRIDGAGNGPLKSWATRAPDGTIRVVLINKGSRASLALVRLPGASSKATLARLTGPAVSATSGVSLGGQSFGHTTESGLLAGPVHTSTETPTGGRYLIKLPPSSAALLSIR
jgi:hypothetical protein